MSREEIEKLKDLDFLTLRLRCEIDYTECDLVDYKTSEKHPCRGCHKIWLWAESQNIDSIDLHNTIFPGGD